MKEILTYVTTHILTHPEDIEILEETDENGTTTLTLITHPEDTGLAIGKSGKTARAMRELLKIKAVQENRKIFLDIKSKDEANAVQA